MREHDAGREQPFADRIDACVPYGEADVVLAVGGGDDDRPGSAVAQHAVDEGVEQRERGGFVGRPAEHVAAEGQRGDAQAGAAEFTKLDRKSVV